MRCLAYAFVLSAGWAMSEPARAQQFDKKKEEERQRQYVAARPGLGEPAPAFVLADLDGKQIRLKDLLGKRPIVIEFGSYT